MGLNLSKRIEKTLSTTPAFTSACAATYAHCLAQAQRAFPGVRPYQLLDAAAHLRSLITRGPTLPILSRWAPPPPTQAHVDSALRRIRFQGRVLDGPQFEKFAVELYRDLIMGRILGTVVFKGVPIGAAAIAGVGMVTGGGAHVVGRAIGVYAAGVAAVVYLGLS